MTRYVFQLDLCTLFITKNVVYPVQIRITYMNSPNIQYWKLILYFTITLVANYQLTSKPSIKGIVEISEI